MDDIKTAKQNLFSAQMEYKRRKLRVAALERLLRDVINPDSPEWDETAQRLELAELQKKQYLENELKTAILQDMREQRQCS